MEPVIIETTVDGDYKLYAIIDLDSGTPLVKSNDNGLFWWDDRKEAEKDLKALQEIYNNE